MADKFSPLSREVRRLSRLRTDDRVRRDYTRWFVLAGVYLVVVALTSPFYLFGPDVYRRGQTVTEQIIAKAPFDFVSQQARDEFERNRREKHKRVYVYKTDTAGLVIDATTRLFETAANLDISKPPEELVETLKRADSRLTFLRPANVVEFATVLRDPRFRKNILEILSSAYDDHVIVRRLTEFRAHQEYGILEVSGMDTGGRDQEHMLATPLPIPDWDAWKSILEPLDRAFDDEKAASRAHEYAELLLSAVIQANLVLNAEMTQEAYNNYPARDLSTSYKAGDVIVSKAAADRAGGLTQDEVDLLAAHRRAVIRLMNVRLAGHAAYTAIVFAILGFYVNKFSRDLQFNTYNIVLIALPVIMGLGVQALLLILLDGKPDKIGFLFPAGAIGMLGVLLLDVRMALMLVTWSVLLFGLQMSFDYSFVDEYIVVAIFGGYTGVAAVYTIRRRWEVFLASFLIGIVNAAVILIITYVNNPGSIAGTSAALGFLCGISSFLILAILPVFERFGIITDMQLLELTGLHHPLLRELEDKAPGTWQHSLNVTKLAEAAAVEIGVNYLLIRAGCYFHDIGKTKKPEYFTENQITNEDKMRHSELRPQMSTLIIKNHVKEGVEMARHAKMPERIIDFIRQHHGTTVVMYFYMKAKEAQERGEIKEPVRLEDYRYPGPKPQTIEAAIVMLADATEATATAKLSGRTVREEDIQQVVRRTILDKFNDGQFDESNLTLRDLNTIHTVFVRVLKSRFHTRIDYPKKSSSGSGASSPRVPKEKRKKPLTESTAQVTEESVSDERKLDLPTEAEIPTGPINT